MMKNNIKTIFKKMIYSFSIFNILIAYFIPLSAFATIKSYKTYLALGDSIAYGYALEDKENNSYPGKVREKLNIEKTKFKNLAVSGMTAQEFYQQIQTTEYTNAIKDADLITISIGSNELLGLVVAIVAKETGISQDDPNFAEKVQEYVLKLGMLQQLQLLNKIYNTMTSEEMKMQISYVIEAYKQSWTSSVNYIKSINSNVTIVATEFYNPYYEVALGSYDLGGFVEENIQKLNNILISSSNSEKEYKIAKIHDEFNTTNPRLTNVCIEKDNLNVDPHPNVSGHEIICNKILDVLTDSTTTLTNIETLTISEIKDATYTGNAIEPEVVIKDGDKILVENTDYTISYNNNVQVGLAKVIIIGIGNYQGTVIKTFNIKEVEQKDISQMTISKIEDQMYLGIKNTPDVEIKDGTKKLVKDVDYELNYSNNINVGKATVTIVGIGNYKGKTTTQFNIVAKDIKTVTIQNIEDQEYTGKALEPEISISDGSAKLVKDIDYTIEFDNNIEVGIATINITGKGNYTGTIQKQFNIIQNVEVQTKDIATLQITDISSKTYTGKLITPEVTITDGEKVLEKNKDYIISYTNNIEIGTGIATIEGIGNYAGKIQKEFEIVRKNIKYTTIEDIAEQTYTGNEIKPEVMITSDYIKLEEGKDYNIKYSNNIEEGTATITIEGKGNYTGTITKTFNIVKKVEEIEKPTEEIPNDEVPQKPEQENDNKDNSIAQKPIPNAGNKLIIMFCIVINTLIASIVYKLYIKYKWIK